MTSFIRIAAATLLAGTVLAGTADARTLIAVLPPDSLAGKSALTAELARLAEGLTVSDRLMLYGARGPAELARIELPDDPRSANLAWRRKRLAEAFRPALAYLADLPVAPAANTIPADLAIAATLPALGANVLPAQVDHAASVLLIGSWLTADPRDPSTAIVHGLYPSDGHLGLRSDQSPYGTADLSGRLDGATVYFCGTNGAGEFASAEHEADVVRFWSLYVLRQGGRVGGFSHDLPTCFARFAGGELADQPAYAVSADLSVAMLRAGTAVPQKAPAPATLPVTAGEADDAFLRPTAVISHEPPATTVGIAQIGLRWSVPADFDLYTRGNPARPWLFFGNVRSDEGVFNHDFRAATGNQQSEFVTYSQPIDLDKAELAINLFDGNLDAPATIVVRIAFGGRIYQKAVELPATSGNGGAQPMSGPDWLAVDLRSVVGLPAR